MRPCGLQVCCWLYRLQQGGLRSILAGIGKVRWQQGLSGLVHYGWLSQSISYSGVACLSSPACCQPLLLLTYCADFPVDGIILQACRLPQSLHTPAGGSGRPHPAAAAPTEPWHGAPVPPARVAGDRPAQRCSA